MEKFQKKIIKEVKENGKVIQYITIALYKDNCGPVPVVLPTPFSAFMLEYQSNKSTTKNKVANIIVQFLNYVFYEMKNPISNIEQLTLQHGIDFLSSLHCCKKSKTEKAAYLSKFYFFCKQNNRIPLVDMTFKITVKPNGNEVVQNIFNGKYEVEPKYVPESIHGIKLEYLPMFFETAKNVVPEIYLGILFQFCGGLRVSEVVSVEYTNIRHTQIDNVKTLMLKLEDKDLRPDLTSAFIAKVKRNRSQIIIPYFSNDVELAYQYYKEHYKVENCNAVFVDANGNAMTEATYRRKFNILKREFIRRLLASDDVAAKQYGFYLSSYKWSTHIGRGTYSNIVAASANNIGDIANLRGDNSLSSALAYLNDNTAVEKKVRNVLNNLYKGEDEDGRTNITL